MDRHLPFLAAAAAVLCPPPAAQIDFAPAVLYSTGNASVYDVEFGDFDRDGDLDMAVASTPVNDGRISIWMNDGRGAFGNPVHHPTGGSIGGPMPTGLAVADLDNDGWLDLACSLFSPGNAVRVLRNDRTGRFSFTQTERSGNATGIAAADLNGDGFADVVTSNSQVTGGTARVFLNDGAGVLLGGVDYPVAGGPRNVTIADLDADGDLDLAVPALFAHAVTVLWNGGNGTFGARSDHAAGIGPSAAAAADFDGDGVVDLVVSSTGAQFTSDVSVLLGNGRGGFAPQVRYAVGYDARGIVAGDLDGDGDADVAVAIKPQAKVFVLLNRGDGTLAAPVPFACGSSGDDSHSLTTADVDGDRRPDLAVGNLGIDETAAVLINRSPWADLGFALPGSAGAPRLSGRGTLAGGSDVAVSLSRARPTSPAILLIARTATPTPFLGGVVLPIPVLASVPSLTSTSGGVDLRFAPWPHHLPPGGILVWQYAILDPGAVSGLALSNGLRCTLP